VTPSYRVNILVDELKKKRETGEKYANNGANHRGCDNPFKTIDYSM
jgi:hypothetical protein